MAAAALRGAFYKWLSCGLAYPEPPAATVRHWPRAASTCADHGHHAAHFCTNRAGTTGIRGTADIASSGARPATSGARPMTAAWYDAALRSAEKRNCTGSRRPGLERAQAGDHRVEMLDHRREQRVDFRRACAVGAGVFQHTGGLADGRRPQGAGRALQVVRQPRGCDHVVGLTGSAETGREAGFPVSEHAQQAPIGVARRPSRRRARRRSRCPGNPCSPPCQVGSSAPAWRTSRSR